MADKPASDFVYFLRKKAGPFQKPAFERELPFQATCISLWGSARSPSFLAMVSFRIPSV